MTLLFWNHSARRYPLPMAIINKTLDTDTVKPWQFFCLQGTDFVVVIDKSGHHVTLIDHKKLLSSTKFKKKIETYVTDITSFFIDSNYIKRKDDGFYRCIAFSYQTVVSCAVHEKSSYEMMSMHICRLPSIRILHVTDTRIQETFDISRDDVGIQETVENLKRYIGFYDVQSLALSKDGCCLAVLEKFVWLSDIGSKRRLGTLMPPKLRVFRKENRQWILESSTSLPWQITRFAGSFDRERLVFIGGYDLFFFSLLSHKCMPSHPSSVSFASYLEMQCNIDGIDDINVECSGLNGKVFVISVKQDKKTMYFILDLRDGKTRFYSFPVNYIIWSNIVFILDDKYIAYIAYKLGKTRYYFVRIHTHNWKKVSAHVITAKNAGFYPPPHLREIMPPKGKILLLSKKKQVFVWQKAPIFAFGIFSITLQWHKTGKQLDPPYLCFF